VLSLFGATLRRALLEYCGQSLKRSVVTNTLISPTSNLCSRKFSATLDVKNAISDEKKAAREYLRKAVDHEDVNVENLYPLSIMASVRESAANKAEKKQEAKLLKKGAK